MKRRQWAAEYPKYSTEILEERLQEVESAIQHNHRDAARFHFERELIRRILKARKECRALS